MKSELIDTLWNVNDDKFIKTLTRHPGINRYIMECKSERYGDIFTEPPELIDTLWNVNFPRCKLVGFKVFELIDTLWNVNVL